MGEQIARLLNEIASVPRDGRGIYGFSEVPYGRLCTEAADALIAERARADAAERDARRLDWMLSHVAKAAVSFNRDRSLKAMTLTLKPSVAGNGRQLLREIDAAINAATERGGPT